MLQATTFLYCKNKPIDNEVLINNGRDNARANKFIFFWRHIYTSNYIF